MTQRPDRGRGLSGVPSGRPDDVPLMRAADPPAPRPAIQRLQATVVPPPADETEIVGRRKIRDRPIPTRRTDRRG